MAEPSEQKTGERMLYPELLRIIACFCVLINHTNSHIFLAAQPGSLTWFASVTYFYCSKVAVPLFLMVSGVTLLPRRYTLRQTLSRTLRYAVILAAFALLYLYPGMLAAGGFLPALKVWVSGVIHGPVTNAYWYLYLYIGVLLMLPFLQLLAANMTRTHYRYLLIVCFCILNTLPILAHFTGLNLSFSADLALPLFTGSIGALFLGSYLERYSTVTGRKALWAALIFAVCTAFNVGMTYYEALRVESGASYLFLDNRYFITIMLPSACLFVLVRYLCSHHAFGPTLSRAIRALGRCTLGIYLLSDFFILRLRPMFTALCGVMHPMFAVVIFEVAVFLCALAVTAALRLIPGVKKLI